MRNRLSVKTPILALACVGIIGLGCASAPTYRDPNSAETLTTGFSYTDVKSTAQKMVDSMLTSPATEDITSKHRPIIVIDRIKNETDQHLNMADLVGAIRTQLVRSGRFRFTQKEGRQAISDEIAYQNRSGMVDTAGATAKGQGLGAEYMLGGRLASYRESYKGRVIRTYRLTLTLTNLQTHIDEWADESDVSKEATRGAVGW